MRLGKDLTNKPIFSIVDGRHLGNVKDIYLDTDLTTITGVFTGQEGMLRRKSFLIPRDSVVVFGIDAILVKDAEVIIEETEQAEAAEWVRLSKLRGRDVDTPNGTKVASIGDVIIGEEGNLLGFALSKVFVEGPIAENGAIARSTLIDTGHADEVMTVELSKAEMTPLGSAKKATEDGTAAEETAETLPDENT